MAEGGFDPRDETTENTPILQGDDDDTDSTQPFEPGAASTPAGEQVPMSTRTRLQPEQQGAHTDETSFITGDTQGRRVITGDTPPEAPSFGNLITPERSAKTLGFRNCKTKKALPTT